MIDHELKGVLLQWLEDHNLQGIIVDGYSELGPEEWFINVRKEEDSNYFCHINPIGDTLHIHKAIDFHTSPNGLAGLTLLAQNDHASIPLSDPTVFSQLFTVLQRMQK
jgi:hypothetical protein